MKNGSVWTRQGERKYLNKAERRRFRVFSCALSPFRQTFALTLLHCGCRISEALELTPERIDLEESIITFRTLKRRNNQCFRQMPMHRDLVILYSDILPQLSLQDRIFDFSRPTGYRIIRSVMDGADIEGVRANPRGLRHGFGVGYAVEKVSTSMIQRWMGHSNPSSTGIYLNALEDEERTMAERLWQHFGLDEIH